VILTRKTNIKLRWTVLTTVIFFIASFCLLLPTQALSRGEFTAAQNDQDSSAEVIPILIKPATSAGAGDSSNNSSNSTGVPLPQVSYDFSSTKMGIYTGPGDVKGHTNFETWLGKPIPYATDYIDYKGGWTTDFHDSNLWLTKPWGNWVSQGNRRLVLGLPMLENSNAGQFDTGVSGAFDSYFRDLATQLVANNLGNSIIRLGYEANCNTIGPWQAVDNPGGYKLLFRHEVAVMKSVPGGAFLFDWTVCNGLQNGHALSSYDSFYPGDDVVDIAGIDIYDVKWQDTSASPQTRWNYIITRQMGVNALLAYAAAHGKPVSFPEWGLYAPGDSFAGGGDDPYFIEQMAGLITSSKPVYQAYFNLDWGGGVLSDFKQGQSIFKEIFQQ
jgi:hypothetical protein